MSVIWQPVTWTIFHLIANNYNDLYREHYINFFESFRTIIPCRICRNHYNQNIDNSENNIEQNVNSDHIFNWTVKLHNNVNKMHHKRVWSYDEAKNYYGSKQFNNNLLKIFILEYVKSNFKKNPEKTDKLIVMLKSFAYLHNNEDKRNQLINFKEKFELNRDTMRNWLLAFLIILRQ